MAKNPDLVPALTALFSAKNLAEMRQVITAHPILLAPETDAHIRRETANVTTPVYRDQAPSPSPRTPLRKFWNSVVEVKLCMVPDARRDTATQFVQSHSNIGLI